MRPENFNIDKLIEHLEGTCKTLDEGCQAFDMTEDDLTTKDLEYIDEEIFKCDVCGWWYEIYQCSEDSTCSDCYEQEL